MAFASVLLCALAAAGCHRAGAQRSETSEVSGPANIVIDGTVAQTDVRRLGINVPAQNYYDSGQIMRNLIFRNPGFEGEIWQSILRCKAVTASSCTDWNQWGGWPANFMQGADFEFITGAAAGQSGKVTMSLPAQAEISNQGETIGFAPLSRPPAIDDFVIVRKVIPGDAQAGWWVNNSGGGAFSSELKDLSPSTQGKQALRISATSGRSAELDSYFDTSEQHSFVRLNGPYRLTFRAKGVEGNNELHVSIGRQSRQGTSFLSKDVKLSPKWADYSFDFNGSEGNEGAGSVALKINVAGATILLDDMSLTSTGTPTNTTAFRDDVVSTLVALHPGVMRYNDEASMGSTIDNLLAPPMARQRAGASTGSKLSEDLALGLHEFLQLCQVAGAEPYYNMPPGMSTDEARNLIEYLGGAPTTPYGAKRAALGQSAPWTSIFPVIHLELGNEQWNGSTFPGSSIADGPSYGKRAKEIFLAARSSSGYQPAKFDLVIGGQGVNTWLTGQELSNSDGYDSISFAPYLFNRFDDASSQEAIFGPMFAQPEMIDSVPTGYMAQQLKAAKEAKKPAKVVVYEVNLQTVSGSADQASFSKAIPSVGAGIALADHMLLMMRDLGIKVQSTWALTGYQNNVHNSATGKDQSTPLFATVVDMGGSTNLRRPQYVAEQLANTAILPTMLKTRISGANPTWNQPKSKNDDIELDKAHMLQAFAFSDAGERSAIVINLSRNTALPITFSGTGAPAGQVEVSQLTSKNITDTNEYKENVTTTKTTVTGFTGSTPYQLPPYSMTIFKWKAAH
jgi:alpha-L-arabinofuranosidase